MASRPRDTVLREQIETTADGIAQTLGQRNVRPRLAEPPDGADPFYFAHVCLALLPAVRRYHRDRGIPDEISWATLSALASNLARHRRIYGIGGLDGPQWVVRVYRGLVYRLGRLVFERTELGPQVAAVRPGYGAADPALGVHIPPAGPLTPELSDDAFGQVVPFFARHFPEDVLTVAHCRSWLLDPQLADYLPDTSNLVRFARRFRPLGDGDAGDSAIVRWIFEVPNPAELDTLAPSTTLERAVLGHLQAGHHWRVRLGWLELPH
jgi:hypothetical protein